jgi:RNA polymerase sigma-70 factor (ECF subfamily)
VEIFKKFGRMIESFFNNAALNMNNPENLSEEILIEKSKRGDSTAFESLVLRYYRQIYQLMFHFVKRPQDAEDLVQEAFLESYRCLKNFKGDSKFYTWLYRIASNLAMNHVRRRRQAVSLEDMLEMPPSTHSSSPYKEIESTEFNQIFQEILLSVSEEKKLVFVLREMHELSYQEIADVVGIKIGTVMSRLSRAREEIREELKKHFPNLAMEWKEPENNLEKDYGEEDF